tara:strand:- start:9030 stop:9728 length:699 start_codon:yes stop_codon:yes gene_type:complete
MKIALLGYGKMGKEIEKLSKKRGHEIVAIIDKDFSKGDISNANVSINFSTPKAAKENILNSLKLNVPVVSGTTGWLKDLRIITDFCKKNKSAFLHSSNFSIGVNIFFKINDILSKLMNDYNDYEASIKETHHTKKLDSPSGTALTLAKKIIDNSNYESWTLKENKFNELPIKVKRIGDVKGNHVVKYDSSIDTIKIEHDAKSREGFALGSIIASEWIIGKTGVFSFNDVLKI